MNKRQLKKREHQQEIEREHELTKTALGRIQLSYEHLEAAFEEFVATVFEETARARKTLSEQLLTRLKTIDTEVAPKVERVPVVGPAVARGLHQVVAVAS